MWPVRTELWPFFESGLPPSQWELQPPAVQSQSLAIRVLFFSYIQSVSKSCCSAFKTYPRAALLGTAGSCMRSFSSPPYVTVSLRPGILPLLPSILLFCSGEACASYGTWPVCHYCICPPWGRDSALPLWHKRAESKQTALLQLLGETTSHEGWTPPAEAGLAISSRHD